MEKRHHDGEKYKYNLKEKHHPRVNLMSGRQRLDKIMTSCCVKIQEDVSVLLGKTLKFHSPKMHLLSKGEFFSRSGGKSVFAHVQLEGDLEGQAGLLLSVADAIRIGGTLIMLPASELASSIAEEVYTEELQDSYGEIANIICGAVTALFEEQYPSNIRFVRAEQEVISPSQVDIESSSPLADGKYYVMQSSMVMEEAQMGDLWFLLPAASFGLVDDRAADKRQDEAIETAEEVPDHSLPREAMDRQDESHSSKEVQSEEERPSVSYGRDPEKEKRVIDRLIGAGLEKAGEDIGVLLGKGLQIAPEKGRVLDKEALLGQLAGKQVMARLDVRGDSEGESFLFSNVSDAIVLGGTLIMLPLATIEETIASEEFNDELEDSFGEIANIIAGSFATVFEEQYRRSLGFVKTGLETVFPIQVDPHSDETLPGGLYYVSSGKMRFNDQELGSLQFVVPLSVLELERLSEASASIEDERGGLEDVKGAARSQQTHDFSQEEQNVSTGQMVDIDSGRKSAAFDILIVTDDDSEALHFSTLLDQLGFTSKTLHYKEAVKTYLTHATRLIFLVMKEVNEQGFAVAIKIRSGGVAVPLIASGPEWTRTLVLQAVKYGAGDILVTPASEEELRETIAANLAKIAA